MTKASERCCANCLSGVLLKGGEVGYMDLAHETICEDGELGGPIMARDDVCDDWQSDPFVCERERPPMTKASDRGWFERAMALARRELARGEPMAAAYAVLDLPETIAADLNDLAYSLSKHGGSLLEAEGLLNALEEATNGAE